MSLKPVCQKHSMDIPHVTAVELPFIVKNEDRAVQMLGGKAKISKVINTLHNPAGSNTNGFENSNEITNSILELRLRNDPFHHPIQSIHNPSESILLKISIPKSQLPHDYYDNPSKYTVKELMKDRKVDVNPVAIIDNTFLFKSMADFQVVTKNNKVVQNFNTYVRDSKNYPEINQYFEQHDNFAGIKDYQDAENFQNNDHMLPPPPLFSPIQFPFDYKYQKNPLTATFKDSESGEIKMIAKKSTPRLHTIIVDFHNNNVPSEPAKTLLVKYEDMKKNRPAPNTLELALFECIQWLETIFKLKPIWTRKHLEDIVPVDLRRVIKQALPYVSYIYKSGPWRFCNVKLGVNPKDSNEFWKYQSEYFRISGLRFGKINPTETDKLNPPTLSQNPEIQISRNLFFDGVTLPKTITYQVGDLLDLDIRGLIEKNQIEENSFFREKPDFQDGWINKQSLESIRSIIRYKLVQLVKEEAVSHDRIAKILATDYTKNGIDLDYAGMSDGQGVDEEVGEDEDDDEVDDDEDDASDLANLKDSTILDEKELLEKVKTHSSLDELTDLVGFIKQDLLRPTNCVSLKN